MGALIKICLFTVLFFATVISVKATRFLVTQKSDFSQIVSSLNAGDTLVLKSGIWSDFEMNFYGEGTGNQPIVLMAEESGKVIITGRSVLRISGNHLLIEGLHFKNGSAADQAVIVFRNGKKGQVANHTRVTNCLIDNFGNNPRWEDDNYIALYGKHNRVDHCYLGRKNNNGVTLVVFLKGEDNWPNYHSIDHNHFGQRPRLGSNGGETIRIGDSGTSLNASHTILENNLFEHCNGETEIVSIKSSDNIIKNNLFYESEGSLVLRHGNRNLVEGNVFIGNFKPYTGGIRLVNYGHKIINNLFIGLNGDGFRAPLSIMCGLENSPLNRYEPVRDVKVEGNMWIACASGWDIGVPFTRKDDEKGFVLPSDVTFRNNIVWNNSGKQLINYISGVPGLNWESNYTNKTADGTNCEFNNTALTLKQYRSIVLAYLSDEYKEQSTLEHYFESAWQSSYGPVSSLISGEEILSKTIIVAPGIGSLNNVTGSLKSSLTTSLVFLSGEKYMVNQELYLNKPISFYSDTWISGTIFHPAFDGNAGNLPVILPAPGFHNEAIFRLDSDGSYKFYGLHVSGTANDGTGVKYGFATQSQGMSGHYNLSFYGSVLSKFKQLDGAVIKGFAGSFARKLIVENCVVEECYTGIVFDEEKKDDGRYNVEELHIFNTLFRKNKGTLLNIYRGGLDESTFGPMVLINNCHFLENEGRGNQMMFDFTGVQVVEIDQSWFQNNRNYSSIASLSGSKNRMTNCLIGKGDKVMTSNQAVIKNATAKNKSFNQKPGLVKIPIKK